MTFQKKAHQNQPDTLCFCQRGFRVAEAEARLQRLKAKSRSLDTAQKVIVGAAMLARVRRPEEAQLRAFLLQFLRKEVTRQADMNRLQPLINELEKLPRPPAKPQNH
nr:mobilization protein [Escherichia coli]